MVFGKLAVGVLALALASLAGAAEKLERQPGESYLEYVERYKNLSEQNRKLNEAANREHERASDRNSQSAGYLPSVSSERRKIVASCRDRVGEYGASIVKTCADNDIEALEALHRYPARHSRIVKSCLDRVGDYGYQIVRTCADNDIEAEEALSRY